MQGAGIGGSNATCIELGPKAGGLTFASRKAAQSGYQPFGQASAVEFWLKDKNGSSTIPDITVSVIPSLLSSSHVRILLQPHALGQGRALINNSEDTAAGHLLLAAPITS